MAAESVPSIALRAKAVLGQVPAAGARQNESSMRTAHLTHQKYHGIAYTYLLLIFPEFRCLPGRKHA
jgi:hypothetical protein